MPDPVSKPAALSTWSGKAMACPITITAPSDGDRRVAVAAREALQVFLDVQETCSRFDASSPLMRANARPDAWHPMPRECFDALRESYEAYVATSGMFDPRVHDTLVANGYDRSLPFSDGDVVTEVSDKCEAAQRAVWLPRFRRLGRRVNLGGRRVDLGGIGKGLAIRWASDRLRKVTSDFLIDAGGDCYASGKPTDGSGWMIGVESPSDPNSHLAVLDVRDMACATSSTRLRRWKAGDRQVHHIIDPTTGEPGGCGLVSMTVLAEDPAWAEVWTKALFLSGRGRVEEVCDRLGLAALWVDVHERLHVSPGARPYVVWSSA